jgi:hypothetical protein
MSSNMHNDQNIPTDTDVYYEYYEELASQAELYLEETDEEVVAILTSYASSASQNDRSTMIDICGERESDLEIEGAMTALTNNPRVARDSDEQLVEAVEELITGDSDDPPLSEEAVQEMVNDSPAGGSDL